MRQLRLAGGLFPYLARPLDAENALAAVRMRLAQREANFLRAVRQAGAPHDALLASAGWDEGRLRTSVAGRGLEATLEALRDDGVATSLEQVKRSARPDRRGFDAATSGTTSAAPTRVRYDWEFFAEEAALECLLFESHGVLDAPTAFWLPALPSISGLHNLLVHLKFRRPPERWFNQLPPRRRDAPTYAALGTAARMFRQRLPRPEPTPLSDAGRVLRWLCAARDRSGRSVLKTFATSALRVAERAQRESVDLSACTFFVGGERLSRRGAEFIRGTGATVFGRYVATETGWIAGACPHAPAPDAMHFYADRLAVVPARADGATPLLFTTLSRNAGLMLLNTDIGDAGRIGRRPCSCALGRAGLVGELSGIYGHDKVSFDGLTLGESLLLTVLDDVIGGAPDSYRVFEEEDANGATRVVIAVAEDTPLDDAALVDAVHERLRAHAPAGHVAAAFWEHSDSIEVRRERLELSAGAKLKRT